LFPIFNNRFKDATVLSHDSRLEEYFNISMFMRMYFCSFLSYFECKWLIWSWISLSHIKLHRTRNLHIKMNKQLLKPIILATNYLIWIDNFEFLKDSIWVLLRDKCSKRKCLFFIEEHIWVYHRLDILIGVHRCHNDLLLEDWFEIITINPWNAWFTDCFI